MAVAAYAMRVFILVVTTIRAPTGATNVYLVIDGDDTSLVDPVARTGRFDDLVTHEGIDHPTVTHTHADHVGAVTAYAHEIGATAWCRHGRERAFSAATGIDLDRMFAEGTIVPIGAGIEVLDTPGRAHDHVNLIVGDDVLCSDLAVAEGSVVVGTSEGDVRVYLTALKRLYARGPKRLHPGYGSEIMDP